MLEFKNLTLHYGGQAATQTPAVADVSFTVERGERVVLLGANGSGKSTLARLANGLLLPQNGEVLVDGMATSDATQINKLRALVGVVAQDPDNQIVCTTVFDEVAFGPQNLGWPVDKIRERIGESLQAVGLLDFEQRDPNTLSGGEKQRLVIAAVLAMNPSYLVLDEPTSMLDPQARREVLATIDALHQSGHGVLQITHDLQEAQYANKLVLLAEGQIVYQGSPQTILANKNILAQYGLIGFLGDASVPEDQPGSEPWSEPGSAPGIESGREPGSEPGSAPGERCVNTFQGDVILCEKDCHPGQDLTKSGLRENPEKPELHPPAVTSIAPGQSSGLSSPPSHTTPDAPPTHTAPDTHQQITPDTHAGTLPVNSELTASDTVLSLANISYTYNVNASNPHFVFQDVSLELQTGSCTLLVGSSGSGKSTLLRIAAALLEPTTGRLHPKLEPGQTGLVFQQPETQLFAQTVAEDIVFGPRNLGFLNSKKQGEQIVAQALAAVGLDYHQFKDRSPFTLSGGEARRVAIAGTLAMQPKFLLLDEPTAGLDARGREFIYQLLRQLKTQGTGILVVTHNPAQLLKLADQIQVLEQGRLRQIQTVEQYKDWSKLWL